MQAKRVLVGGQVYRCVVSWERARDNEERIDAAYAAVELAGSGVASAGGGSEGAGAGEGGAVTVEQAVLGPAAAAVAEAERGLAGAMVAAVAGCVVGYEGADGSVVEIAALDAGEVIDVHDLGELALYCCGRAVEGVVVLGRQV